MIGAKTLAAINACDPLEFHRTLCELSDAYYRHVATVNPAQAVYLKGWLKHASA
ncbi:MAG TPA: putative peptidoglycan-binding domain-containing protein [Candidatus Angelobacter sp.]|nr:putative peptidoglycan-binding domain-containing protein [Candidatus Angelobacter sp.]